jgi:hypothetical protein
VDNDITVASMVPKVYKDVKGYRGIYRVNIAGQIYSMPREVSAGNPGQVMKIGGKYLKPYLNTKGYPSVSLNKGGKKKTTPVHVIVAQAFLGDRPNGFHINHIDGNKENNHIDNLEYVSPKDNMRHSFALGLHKLLSGKDAPNYKHGKYCLDKGNR